MRTLERNKQNLYYALYVGEEPEYVLDESGNKVVAYTDDEGNVYYEETGRKVPTYGLPIPFSANISTSGGEATTQEYGIDVSNYDALILLEKDEVPLEETSLIWFESEPRYTDADRTVLDGNSADYKVLAIKPSLNQLKVVLGRLTK